MLDWETGEISCLQRNSLDEDMPTRLKEEFYSIEITINHPRTAPFKRLSPERQKSLLNSLYFKARSSIVCEIYEDTVRHEQCLDGVMHLHSYIYIKPQKPFYPRGIVMGCAKAILYAMPVRTQAQLSNYHYCDKFKTFKSPAVCVQFTPFSDSKRILQWETYINKNI